MLLKAKGIKTVKDWVISAKKTPIKSFYATAISKDTGLPLNEVLAECFKLA